jgi:general L-amino acid transport system permease protein
MSETAAFHGLPPAKAFQARAARPAPPTTVGVLGWMRRNLFSSIPNTLLTIVCCYLIYALMSTILNWAVFTAVWDASTRRECMDQVGRAGACWPGVVAWFPNLIYGLYPKDQVWRINTGFLVLVLWLLPLWLPGVRSKVSIGLAAVLLYPFLASYFFLGGDKGILWSLLIAGGLWGFVWVWLTALGEIARGRDFAHSVLALTGLHDASLATQRRAVQLAHLAGFLAALMVVSWWALPEIRTRLWGGLFLTLVVSGIGITFSLPAGVLLALGRRSHMPVISMLCTAFIELFRSVPLITILFMFTTMLPLFLPVGVEVDLLVRAIVAVCLFAAAYMAEVIRGGLQAIPKGQYEAAAAVGLGYWQTTGLIILPQALKIMIPTIVGNFIGLFKDTTLVSIIGLFDLLNMARVVGQDPTWLGMFIEPFFAVTVIYFIFCYAMSTYSQHLEAKLETGHRRR